MASKKSDKQLLADYENKMKQLKIKQKELQQKVNNKIANFIKKQWRIETVEELKKSIPNQQEMDMLDTLENDYDIKSKSDLNMILNDNQTQSIYDRFKTEFNTLGLPANDEGLKTLFKVYQDYKREN